ncbi:MAG TPA: hypothetical protein VJC01_01120 [Candidatus Paceibacterota bacterium]
MQIQKIYIGGWFQRTTLHMSEVWDFLKYGKSQLDFPPEELAKAREVLAVSEVVRENGPLEYLAVKTNLGINFRIYEDGLIVLEKDFVSLKSDFKEIREYYESKLSKSLSLIFSKGAPVPKELANIKTILPYILNVADAERGDVEQLFKDFSEDIYSVLSTQNVEVYRAAGIILINNLRDENLAREVIESQIFFRDFKSQLHRYLNIHRIIWEKIDQIKERGAIKGTEIDALRNELSLYQKTINLIGARIEQMDVYVHTRSKITDTRKIDEYLQPLFQFKFETLLDTQEYMKQMWVMTQSYLDSTLELFNDLQAKSTKNTISSLQLITTIGVVAAILGYLGKDALPKFTAIGLVYFSLLLAMTYIINFAVSRLYKNKKYPIKARDIVRDIK